MSSTQTGAVPPNGNPSGVPKKQLPITIVGGYLGTGKTSLVNHLLRHADGLRLAVLVNEFGSLSIDEDLIVDDSVSTSAGSDRGAGGASNLISIAGGCVCCSYGNDLTLALLDMLDMDPRPDHVLLEASGVALPGAIAASVSLLPGYLMDGIAVLVSAETVREQAQDTYIGDTILRQLEHADLVVLNKTDLIDDKQLEDTQQWLVDTQPGAKVVPTEHGQLPPAVLFNSFEGRRDPIVSTTSLIHNAELYATCSFKVDYPVDANAIARTLANDYPGVLRVKGFVKTVTEGSDEITMCTLQVVGRRWVVTPAPLDVAFNLVVIGLAEGFDEDKIRALIEDKALCPPNRLISTNV